MCVLVRIFGPHEHLFNLLRVVGGKANKHKHADVAHDKVEHSALKKEEVRYRCDDNSNESHQQYLAQTRQVGLGEVAKQGHCAESSCGDEERLGDDTGRIGEENHRERCPVEGRVEDEKQRCRCEREPVDETADAENQRQLGNDEHHEHGTAFEHLAHQHLRVGHAIGRNAGDDEGKRHPNVHFTHQCGEGKR